MRLGVIGVALVACGSKSDETGPGKDRDAPIRIAFSDCTGSPVPFVSGPRPLPPEAEATEATARDDGVPTASLGSPTAAGDLDKAIIRRYIRRHIQEIQSCYEKQLLSSPSLAGRVVARFYISPSGKVARATASGVDPRIASCVADVIKAIEFPRPTNGGVAVNYPFNFRIAGSDPAAPPGPPGSRTGMAEASDPRSAAAPSPPPAPAAAPYQPGAHNPLRQVEPRLAACLRGATFGALTVDLDLDPTTGQAIRATPATTDTQLAECITAAAGTVQLDTPGPSFQRCGFAYGVMPAAAVPTIAITATDVAFNGKVVDHTAHVLADSSSSWKIAALFDALDAWQRQPPPQGTVPIRGPGLLEPLDQTPMKLVTSALSTAYAAATDFLLAAQRGPQWTPLRAGIVLPVPPVPLGSGGTWSGTAIAHDGPPTADERIAISVLVARDRIWVGLSRVNEFQEVPGRDLAKLEQVLKEHKASALFADRTDLEIAGADDVVHGDVVQTIEIAAKLGFTDWKVLPPAALAARIDL